MFSFERQDVGNVIFLEHINLAVSDAAVATAFYFESLGLTNDPGKQQTMSNKTIWANIGTQQFHLPPVAEGAQPQVLNGSIGIQLPDLTAFTDRLKAMDASERLKNTKYSWKILDSSSFRGIYVPESYKERVIEVTCPYGNTFFAFQALPGFGFGTGLGILFAQIDCKIGSAISISNYYRNVFDAETFYEPEKGLARVICGDWNQMIFVEKESPRPFTGYHIAFYVARFSQSYQRAKVEGSLLLKHKFNDTAHTLQEAEHYCQFRTGAIVIDKEVIHEMEHEIRSIRHPMFKRPLLNAHPAVPPTYLPNYGLNKEEYAKKKEIEGKRADLIIRKATEEDIPEITRIHNEGIEDRLATLDTDLKTPEERLQWLRSKGERHPIWVATSQTSGSLEVLGWLSINVFNTRKAYDNCVDFSLYISRTSRGKGVGKALLSHAIDQVTLLGYHKLLLAGFPKNSAGVSLYKSCGFREVGVYVEQGNVDGNWVDIVLMEKIINGPKKH